MGRWISKEQMAKRRKRVAELKAYGLTHKKIALRMGISIGISESDYKQYKKQNDGS